MTIQLETGSPFIDPRWMRKVVSGVFECEVTDARQVNLEGELLTFPNHHPEIAPGVIVRVWLDRNFVCELLSDFQAREEQRQEQSRLESLQYKAMLNAGRDNALAFNRALNIPFQWQTGYKDVLSGLSGRSLGDGRNKATVGHIELREDCAAGRLSRRRGDFLCTTNTGKQWSGDSRLQCIDGDGELFDAKVTCKACLTKAQRFKAEGNNV